MRLDARDWLRARKACPDGLSIWFVPDPREPVGLLLALVHRRGRLEPPPFPFDRVREERAQGLVRSVLADLPATPLPVLVDPIAFASFFGDHWEHRDLGRWNENPSPVPSGVCAVRSRRARSTASEG